MHTRQESHITGKILPIVEQNDTRSLIDSPVIGCAEFSIKHFRNEGSEQVPSNAILIPEVTIIKNGHTSHFKFETFGAVMGVGMTVESKFASGWSSSSYQQMLSSGNFAGKGALALDWSKSVQEKGVIDWYLVVSSCGSIIDVYSVVDSVKPWNKATINFPDSTLLAKLCPFVSFEGGEGKTIVTIYEPTIVNKLEFVAPLPHPQSIGDHNHWQFKAPWDSINIIIFSDHIILVGMNWNRLNIKFMPNGEIENRNEAHCQTLMIPSPEETQVIDFLKKESLTWKIVNGIMYINDKQLIPKVRESVLVEAVDNDLI